MAEGVASRAAAVQSPRIEIERQERMKRIELLKLNDPSDVERWQVIQNDSARYSVVSEQVNVARGDLTVEYSVLIVYYEIGDNLPLAKPKDDLRRDDAERISAAADGGSESFDAVFGNPDDDGIPSIAGLLGGKSDSP